MEVQVVWSNVSKCRRDSHHSSHSISPNCLPYDLLVLRFTHIVSHWSKTCFLLKLFSPFSVDLLIRAITYRDGRFQLADEIVNVNGASLRYQTNFNHPCLTRLVSHKKYIAGVWQWRRRETFWEAAKERWVDLLSYESTDLDIILKSKMQRYFQHLTSIFTFLKKVKVKEFSSKLDFHLNFTWNFRWT